MAETAIQDINLQEAIRRYLDALGDGKAQDAFDVRHFGRWFQSNPAIGSLRPVDIERYGEEASKNPVDAQRRLESVRAFLAFAKKQGFTEMNLATHLRLRRTGTGGGTTDVLASDRIEVTAEGLTALQSEHTTLVARRPEMAEELRVAMADKDFRENAPLDAAREKQAHLEARIRELEATLKRAMVVDTGPEASGRARMGSRIRLLRLDNNQEISYTLVGPGEVNAGQGRISIQSPVGRAVVNRTPGEEVEVTAPAGLIRFRLEAVES